MSSAWCGVMLAVALSAAAPEGAPLAGPSARLTVDDAVARALAANPQIEAFEAYVDEEAARGGLGTELENPELRVNDLRPDRLIAPLTQPAPAAFPLDGTDVQLRWSPPRISTFGPRQTEARRRMDRRSAERDVAARDLALEVRTLFAEARALEAKERITGARVDVARRAAEVLRAAREAQLATSLDVGEAEVTRAERLADHASVRAERAGVLGRLLVSLRWPEGTPPPELVAPAEPPCRAAFEAAPAAERAEVRALIAQAEEADARQLTGWLDAVPWLRFVQVGYELGATRAEDFVSVGLSFDLPVLHWNQGEILAMRARARRFRAEAEAAKALVEAERQAALLAARASAERLGSVDEERAAIAAAVATLAEIESDGGADPEERLKLEDRLLEAELRAVDAELACAEAAVALESAGGL